MQISALRYFLETANSGSIRKAAERLHVAPTAIGRQIENLEQFVQAPLFERSAKGMRMTQAGQELAARLSPVIRELETIRNDIHDLRGLKRGVVSIYAAEALAGGFLGGVLARFRSKYPGITFAISIAGADRTFEALRADTVDIGLTLNAPKRQEISVIASAHLTNVAAVSPKHPLARRKSARLPELLAHPLALPDTSFGARRALDKAAQAESVQIEPAYLVNSLSVMKGLAHTGAALIFAPLVSLREEVAAGTLVPIRIDNKTIGTVEVGVCVHRNRRASGAASMFLEVVSSALQQLRPSGT